jgi:hypothetical protein
MRIVIPLTLMNLPTKAPVTDSVQAVVISASTPIQAVAMANRVKQAVTTLNAVQVGSYCKNVRGLTWVISRMNMLLLGSFECLKGNILGRGKSNVWNMDESGFGVGTMWSTRVLSVIEQGTKGRKVFKEDARTVGMDNLNIECMSAAGKAFSPLVILKWKPKYRSLSVTVFWRVLPKRQAVFCVTLHLLGCHCIRHVLADC